MGGTVGVVGLGLIGGSLAKAVKARTNYRVLGCDISEDVVAEAKEQKAIDDELGDSNLQECGIVVIALYPDEAISYCKRNFAHMQNGAIIVDCTGVKTRICAELSAPAKQRSLRFVGGHPMAGTERAGFANSFAELFDGAAMILCEDEHTDRSALKELQSFFISLGFADIIVTTAREHDEIIAYTSQLTHLVSNAYVKSDTIKKRFGFSAGSFKDLTRIAKLNENMWTALFLENRENLLREADVFLEHVRQYRDALAGSDSEAMKELLRKGAKLKAMDELEEKKWSKK